MAIDDFLLPSRCVRLKALAAFAVLLQLAAGATPSAAAPQIVADEPTFDFGTVTDMAAIAHSFIVRNDGDEALVINRIRPTCGCTTAGLATNRLAPGESVGIDTILSLKGRSGQQHKLVYVESNDPANPRYALTIKGVVFEPVTVRPAQVTFRLSPSVPPTERLVTITFNADTPHQITAVSTQTAAFCRVELQETMPGKQYQLRVTLPPDFESDAPYVSGAIRLETDNPDSPTLNIPISIAITRDVLISPMQVNLRADSNATAPESHALMLRNRINSPLTIVDVKTPSPDIRVEQKAYSPAVHRLTLIFDNPTADLEGESIEITARREGQAAEVFKIPIHAVKQ